MGINLVRIMLSTQRALLGNVSANLRAVLVGTRENIIESYFYYDGEISDDDYECRAHAIDQIIADFNYDEYGREIEFESFVVRLDFPRSIPSVGTYVYLRHE